MPQFAICCSNTAAQVWRKAAVVVVNLSESASPSALARKSGAFSQCPASFLEQGHALLRIEGVDGDVFITGVSPVGVGDEGVHHQRFLLLRG